MRAFKCICTIKKYETFIVFANDITNAKIVFSQNYPSLKIKKIEEIIESGVVEIYD